MFVFSANNRMMVLVKILDEPLFYGKWAATLPCSQKADWWSCRQILAGKPWSYTEHYRSHHEYGGMLTEKVAFGWWWYVNLDCIILLEQMRHAKIYTFSVHLILQHLDFHACQCTIFTINIFSFVFAKLQRLKYFENTR